MATVLILGAAGRLGQALVPAFATAGWQVLAQSRKPLPAALLHLSGVRPLCCDALDHGPLLAGARGASVVINALNPPYHQWERLALPLAQAAQALAHELGALLMLPGNVYNYGSNLPACLTPDTPELGDTSKARIRIEIEQRMAAAPGLDSVVLRAGDFFGGSGRGNWFDLVVASRLNEGRLVYPGPLDRMHAWAYLPDLAQAFVKLAERRERLRGHSRMNFAGHAVEGQVLLEALQVLLDKPLRAAILPWPLIRLAAPLVPRWKAIAEMRYLWERPHRLDEADLRMQIGEPAHTPLPIALGESLAALGMAPEWHAARPLRA